MLREAANVEELGGLMHFEGLVVEVDVLASSNLGGEGTKQVKFG